MPIPVALPNFVPSQHHGPARVEDSGLVTYRCGAPSPEAAIHEQRVSVEMYVSIHERARYRASGKIGLSSMGDVEKAAQRRAGVRRGVRGVHRVQVPGPSIHTLAATLHDSKTPCTTSMLLLSISVFPRGAVRFGTVRRRKTIPLGVGLSKGPSAHLHLHACTNGPRAEVRGYS
jgi:hypothetical protein